MKKGSDGKYRKDITYEVNGKRKRKSIRANTKVELNAKIEEFKQQQKCKVKNGATLFKDYFDEWLASKSKTIQSNSLQRYKECGKHCEKIFYKQLENIERSDIQNIIDNLHDRPRMAEYVYIMLNQIFENAIDDECIYRNPCRKIIRRKYKAKQKRMLTKNEEYILDNCEYADKQKMFLTLLRYTGLRRGEALALTKSDFDFENNIINVDKAISFDSNQPTIKTPKTESGIRKVPILNEAKQIYMNYIENCTEDYLFTTQKGELITKMAFRRMWDSIINKSNKFAKENGLAEVSFTSHIFRHNFASILHKSNIPLKTAQNILGHADASTTLNIYTHLDKNSIHEATKLLNENIK